MTDLINETKCPKCDGRGEIAAFRSVAGGVCFTCKGAGHVKGRVATPSRVWACTYAGQALFNKKAKTEAEVKRKAIAHMRNHRDAPAFRGVTEEQVEVRLAEGFQ